MAPPTVLSDGSDPLSFQADMQEYPRGHDAEVEGTLKALHAATYVTPFEVL
jgi:hypothetical protein